MKIVLVRHVESYGNLEKRFNGVTESEITEFGREMQKILIERLLSLDQSYQFQQIYSSPISRAAQTAEIFTEKTGKELSYKDELKEYNFGIFDGLTIKQCMEDYPEIYEKWINNHIYEKIPEGDSFYEKYLEAKNFIKTQVDLNSNVIIFTHGAMLRCFLAVLLDLPIECSWHFDIQLGGFCIINYENGFGTLEGLDNSIYGNKNFEKNFVK